MLGNANLSWSSLGGLKGEDAEVYAELCMYERETPFCYREKLMRAAHDHGGSFNPVLWLYVMLSMVVNQRGCDVTKVSKIVNSNRKV